MRVVKLKVMNYPDESDSVGLIKFTGLGTEQVTEPATRPRDSPNSRPATLGHLALSLPPRLASNLSFSTLNAV